MLRMTASSFTCGTTGTRARRSAAAMAFVDSVSAAMATAIDGRLELGSDPPPRYDSSSATVTDHDGFCSRIRFARSSAWAFMASSGLAIIR